MPPSPPFSFLLAFLKNLLCWSTFLHLPISHLSWPRCCCHLALHPPEEFWAELVDRKCFACKIQPSPQSPDKQTPTLLRNSWHCFLQQPNRVCRLILSLWNVRSLAVGFHLSIDPRWWQDRAVMDWWGSWEGVYLDIRAVQHHSYLKMKPRSIPVGAKRNFSGRPRNSFWVLHLSSGDKPLAYKTLYILPLWNSLCIIYFPSALPRIYSWDKYLLWQTSPVKSNSRGFACVEVFAKCAGNCWTGQSSTSWFNMRTSRATAWLLTEIQIDFCQPFFCSDTLIYSLC